MSSFINHQKKKKDSFNYYLFIGVDDTLSEEEIKTKLMSFFKIDENSYSFCDFVKNRLLLVWTDTFYPKKIIIHDLKLSYEKLEVIESVPLQNNKSEVWIYNFPEFKDPTLDFIQPIFYKLLNYNGKIRMIPSDENPHILFFNTSQRGEMEFRLSIILHVLQRLFMSRMIITYDDSELPIVHMSGISLKLFKECFVLEFLKHKIKVMKCWSKGDDDDWIQFSVETNEKAWFLINRFNFGSFDGKPIQFKHFLSIDKQSTIKKWNLDLIISDDEAGARTEEGGEESVLWELYHKYLEYGQIYSLAINTQEKNRFFLQYLKEEDAEKAVKSDQKHLKYRVSTNNNSKMLVYNFDGTEEELRSFFKLNITDVEKKDLNAGYRPMFFISFGSVDDLNEGLRVGSEIIYKGIRLTCLDGNGITNLDQINDLLKSLSFEKQKKNGVFIPKINNTITHNEVIEALNNQFGPLENCQLINNNVCAAFIASKDYLKAINLKKIMIKNHLYQLKPYK